MLRQPPAIGQQQTLIVNLNRFGPSSLEFFVYGFTRTTNWVEFHAIKEEVMLGIIEIIAAEGAEIAFPTTTVHLAASATGAPSSPSDRSGNMLES